jgi:magnesium transporter
MYCLTVLIFALVMIYHVAPRYGRQNPVIYISICSLVGSVSVMAIKGFGVAVKLTLGGGGNQFTHPSTYVFGLVVVVCILVQMNYFNKALDTFSTNVYVHPQVFATSHVVADVGCSVNPMYYVGFSTATVVASLILFQGFNTTDGTNTVSLLAGFVVTFLGVHLLNVSRQPSPEDALPQQAPGGRRRHPSSDASGIAHYPRLSLEGIGPWTPPPLAARRNSLTLSQSQHGRASSVPQSHARTNSGTLNLFGSFAEGGSELVGLRELREVREEEEGEDVDDDADERTLLRAKGSVLRRENGGPPDRSSPRPT